MQRLRPDVVAEREVFAEWQKTIDGARVVCVDESGIVIGARVGYGYAPRGERCVEHAPYRKGKRTNLLGWVGLGRGKVIAVQGYVDGDVFEMFVREHLAPSLLPGDIVVWDNHSIHKRPVLREMIEARGATLVPQPRYSPEFNTSEPMWSKVKHFAKRARSETQAALHEALDTAVGMLTWEDSAGWLRYCGYTISPMA